MRLMYLPAVFLATAAIQLTASPAPRAEEPYRWCAIYVERDGSAENCGFDTLEQCRATVSGIGGFCEENLRYLELHKNKQPQRAKRGQRPTTQGQR